MSYTVIGIKKNIEIFKGEDKKELDCKCYSEALRVRAEWERSKKYKKVIIIGGADETNNI